MILMKYLVFCNYHQREVILQLQISQSLKFNFWQVMKIQDTKMLKLTSFLLIFSKFVYLKFWKKFNFDFKLSNLQF